VVSAAGVEQPAGDRDQQLLRQPGDLVEQHAEAPGFDDVEVHVALRGDGRRPRPAVDQPHLADHLVGADRAHLLAVDRDRRLTGDDHVGDVRRLALAGQDAARGDVHLVGDLGDAFELTAGQAGEQGDVRQPVELRVLRHRVLPSWPVRRRRRAAVPGDTAASYVT
jgi:hypothetical protein